MNNNIVCVIDQEAKYTRDSVDGSRQFRVGYLAALTAIVEFLEQSASSDRPKQKSETAIRLSSFQSLGSSLPWADAPALMEAMSAEERKTVENVLHVMRKGSENRDYLEWWLHSFAGPEWHDRSRPCPMFPDQSAPNSEAELDALDARLQNALRTAKSS